MPDLAAAQRVLSQLGWLSVTPERFRDSVLKMSVLKKFAANEIIYATGDPASGMYGLVSGGVRVEVAPRDQAPFAVHLFVPGTWMGEGAAISGQARILTLAATRDTQLLYLTRTAITTILNDDPDAFRTFARLGQMHLETALGAIGDLMLRKPDKRLIASLLRLCGSRFETPEGLGIIDIDLSQDDIALMSNVGRTKANAILQELQERGQVEINYRRIRVLAPDELRARLSATTPSPD